MNPLCGFSKIQSRNFAINNKRLEVFARNAIFNYSTLRQNYTHTAYTRVGEESSESFGREDEQLRNCERREMTSFVFVFQHRKMEKMDKIHEKSIVTGGTFAGEILCGVLCAEMLSCKMENALRSDGGVFVFVEKCILKFKCSGEY